MSTNDVEKVVKIIEDIKVGMLTTRSGENLLSRPLTAVQVTDDGDLWFFIATESEIAQEVAKDRNINISFSDKTSWVSVRGIAEIVRDVGKKEELWNPAVEAFARGGAKSPNVALLHVSSESAEYWENPGGPVSLAASWVKHKLTGEQAHPGDSGVVDL
ncbi:pyridoxamine 5'-phosphate oxidase family protein [Glutamicibacter soli]|nr:pyridoxamine 5'-phosphate oxidase family protein [Arthrobacter sp. YC-RL1]ALQ29485.1 pyridoxamine 5'-phosphate oxidase [Arthrobacter sp. YC-RL1]KLI89134.1 pyridoxamine 5'-phosphate oxidase [Arthrobacter sp. YC-RL1]